MPFTDHIHSSILTNSIPAADHRIGVEIESFYYHEDGSRLRADLKDGFSAGSLKKLLEDRLSGLNDWGSISIEPGGQFEWASAPARSLFDIGAGFRTVCNQVDPICRDYGLMRSDLSLEPQFEPEDIPLIDMEKYRLMDARFGKSGTQGRWMMRNTTSVQVNLDYSSEQDAEEMAFIADCLTPLASILFSNSPFKSGRPVGRRNERLLIWENTDASRCGYLMDHGIDESAGLVGRFSRFVLKTPAIFVTAPDGGIVSFEGSLGDWLNQHKNDGRLDVDVQFLLHQMFTHIRFKKVIEIRGADRPPIGWELAPAAFWVGLLYVPAIRRQILEEVRGWTRAERQSLNQTATRLDVSSIGPRNRSVGDWINRIVELAVDGLNQRTPRGEKTEAVLLAPYLEDFIHNGPPTLQHQAEFSRSGLTLREFLRRRMTAI